MKIQKQNIALLMSVKIGGHGFASFSLTLSPHFSIHFHISGVNVLLQLRRISETTKQCFSQPLLIILHV